MKKWFYTVVCCVSVSGLCAQQAPITGTVRDKSSGDGLAGATVRVGGQKAMTDRGGRFAVPGNDTLPVPLIVSMVGYKGDTILVTEPGKPVMVLLETASGVLADVVITGTMKAVQKSASPVPVEVYQAL